jgi:DNA-nicking Smr family endonuclease
MASRIGRYAANTAATARTEKMHPHEINLHGLSLDEAEAKVREMIDAAQEEEMALYELAMVNIGADPADFAAVARLRAEHVRLREGAIENLRAMVARGGKGLVYNFFTGPF